ncbi:hypothetical protein HRbin15_00906 [bacterium HR15]|nr:hypothetical protein HRbin15_00906 [bacterium HR15]
MRWAEIIEAILRENKGVASLESLYQGVSKYRSPLPAGDWQKTLRGVLYREVRRGRFIKVGLGVYALPERPPAKTSAYTYALEGKSAKAYLSQLSDPHSAIEGMLIEIGNFMEYLTYTCDQNRFFDGKRLGDLCRLQQVPPFTYPDLQSLVARCDVVWFGRTQQPFPKFIYEVEATTDFTNSLLKMYQLLDFNARFILVAPEKRRALFEQRLQQAPFAQVRQRFAFRPFEQVARFYFSCVEHYELRADFLSD